MGQVKKKPKDRATIIIIGFIILIISAFIYLSISRKETLSSDFTITKATINEVLIDVPKGTITRQNIAKYSYKYNTVTYHKIVQIYKKNITTGTCYEVKVSNKNPAVNKINLDKKINCDE